MLNVIEAIEKQLQAQKDEIFFKDMQIQELKTKLAAAEEEKTELRVSLQAYIDHIESGVTK